MAAIAYAAPAAPQGAISKRQALARLCYDFYEAFGGHIFVGLQITCVHGLVAAYEQTQFTRVHALTLACVGNNHQANTIPSSFPGKVKGRIGRQATKPPTWSLASPHGLGGTKSARQCPGGRTHTSTLKPETGCSHAVSTRHPNSLRSANLPTRVQQGTVGTTVGGARHLRRW